MARLALATMDRAGAAGGGALSNTPPQNRQTGGEDWFEVMVYIQWDREKLDRLSEALDAAKEAAADGSGSGWTQSLPGSKGLWQVHPHGCRLGDSVKGPIMRWRFERDGITFGMTKRYDPHDTLPSGFVRMTGEMLIALGDARAMWSKVVEWFAELGATVTTAKLSRVDMCVDLPGVAVAEFIPALRESRYITRTKKDAEVQTTVYRTCKRETGFTMGMGTLVRVYDKLAELKEKGGYLTKGAWMVKNRWGGSVPDKATRIEFQLRREFLTACKCKSVDGKLVRPGIDTVDDYFEMRAALGHYLTHQWLRFCGEDFDRRQPKRASTMPVWERVQCDMAQWTGNAAPRLYSPLKRREVSVEDLMLQCRGCMEAAAARCGLYVEQPDDLFYFALGEFTKIIDRDAADMPRRVAQKMKHTIRPEFEHEPEPAPF